MLLSPDNIIQQDKINNSAAIEYPDFSSGSLTPVSSAISISENSEPEKESKAKKPRSLDNVAKLFRAAKLNQSNALRRILETGLEPDCLMNNNNKNTALAEAFKLGNYEAVQILLKYGAEVNQSILSIESTGESRENSIYLMNYYFDRVQHRRNALNVACAMGNYEKVIEILSKRNFQSENSEIDGSLIQELDGNGLSPLHEACFYGHYNLVNYFVKSFNNLDWNIKSQKEKNTPLHDSMMMNQREVTQLLLSIPSIDINALNGKGKTPLDYANDSLLGFLNLNISDDEDDEESANENNHPEELKESPSSALLSPERSREEKKLLQMIASYEKIALKQKLTKRKRKDEIKRGRKPKIEKELPVESENESKKVKKEEAEEEEKPAKEKLIVNTTLPISRRGRPVTKLDINYRDKITGQSQLHKYVLKRDLTQINQLLDLGADVLAKDKNDKSSLELAVLNGYDNIAQIMLSRKKNIEASILHSLIKIAKEKSFDELAAILESNLPKKMNNLHHNVITFECVHDVLPSSYLQEMFPRLYSKADDQWNRFTSITNSLSNSPISYKKHDVVNFLKSQPPDLCSSVKCRILDNDSLMSAKETLWSFHKELSSSLPPKMAHKLYRKTLEMNN